MLYGGASPGGKARTAVDSLGEAYRPAPEEDYTIPFGQAAVRREGNDVTVVATSLMVFKALEAAAVLEREGVSVEVIDPRTLVPLDSGAILDSVRRTGRAVVASEDVSTCGVAAEIAALIADEALFYLLAPVKRVCTPATPIPFAPVMESEVIPSAEKIVAAVREILSVS
jgi:pyruvate/2-oxoglutarate/acetoin dehydrogenase E1 component